MPKTEIVSTEATSKSLAFLAQAKTALANVRTIDEAKELRDKAAAARVYAKQAGMSLEAQNDCAEIKIRAEVKAGELLKDMADRGEREVRGGNRKSKGRDVPLKLSEIGIENHQSKRWQQMASVEPEKREEFIAATRAKPGSELRSVGLLRLAKEQTREKRRERNREIIESVPTPEAIIDAKFAAIVIDPPWDWGDEGDQDQLGRARPTYDTMSIDQITELPVGKMADTDCHLYLWITNRSLPKGFALLDAWGFRYVTCLTWCKPHFGMGNYFRGSTEQILFGVKGSQPLKRKNVGTWFVAKRGPKGHSSKPVEFYDLVESCSPGPYLEMFSRSERADWTHWGEASGAV